MALIIRGTTECSLCGTVLIDGDDLVATSHFIADEDDPLWRFSDSAMHRRCFLAWELRQRFIDMYNERVGSITWGNGTFHSMTDDGTIRKLPREAAAP